MKKNIIGLAVFSLIVGIAVIIESAFFVPEQSDYLAVAVNKEYLPAKETSCRRIRRRISETSEMQNRQSEKLSIKQAVLNLHTKQIDWEMTVPHNNPLFVLHFFVKDDQGTRYIASEVGPGMFGNDADTSKMEFTSSYLWLDTLGAYQNLYVVPEQLSFSEYRSSDFSPEFDKNTAVPILLYAPDKTDDSKSAFLRN